MIDKPKESLKDRQERLINNAEKACRTQGQIGQRTFGLVCLLNYVRCMEWIYTERHKLRRSSEYILCR